MYYYNIEILIMSQEAESPHPQLGFNIIEDWKKKLESDKWRLVRIEILVFTGAIFFTSVLIWGPYRRRSSNKVSKFILWTASILNYTLVSYVIGIMQSTESSVIDNSLFPVWAVFMMFVFGRADSFTAFSLEDNEHWKKYWFQLQIQLCFTQRLIDSHASSDRSGLHFPLLILLILINIKLVNSVSAFKFASRSSSGGFMMFDKVVADYMIYEHELGHPAPDPAEMRGYNYLVNGDQPNNIDNNNNNNKKQLRTVKYPSYLTQIDITSNTVVTVDQIWHCKGPLLNTSGDPVGKMLKDVCLSFALFKLLRRRFSGYPLGEQNLQKTRDFVFKGLLKEGDDDDGGERAFKVIEEELAFLFDFFYTKYPIIFHRGLRDVAISLLMLVFSTWLTYLAWTQEPANKVHVFSFHGKNDDVILTLTIMIFIVIIELVQLARNVTSNWAKVWLVSKYVSQELWQNRPWLGKLIWFFCRWARWLKPWKQKLGQYSLLESYSYNPSNLMSKITFGLIDKTKDGHKEGKSIKLPTQVKQAVIVSLMAGEGQLTNGTSSLQQNGVSAQLSWACGLETHTHTILVWHIATSLCELADSGSELDEITGNHRLVAISLSRYCAYLVAFVPKLLPDHSYTSEDIFDRVVSETRSLHRRIKSITNQDIATMSSKRKLAAILWLGLVDGANTIVEMGVKLGKQLIEDIEDQSLRWRIVGEFWAEMMLFVAPSDVATAHAESLAEGGEFVTHLWALLTHAGILERDPTPYSPPQSEPV